MGGIVAMDTTKVAAIGQLEGGIVRPAVLPGAGRDGVEESLGVEVLHYTVVSGAVR